MDKVVDRMLPRLGWRVPVLVELVLLLGCTIHLGTSMELATVATDLLAL